MIARKINKFWIYFQTGHRQYLAWLLTFFNFITLQYTLVINKAFPNLEISIITFSTLFLTVYFPISYAIGWLSYSRGPKYEEAALTPYNQDFTQAERLTTQALKRFILGDKTNALTLLDESIKIREKWMR